MGLLALSFVAEALVELRDPVHQFVTISDIERRVIDSRPVQRLRHIRQLSTGSFVYPGAVHTRFEHSLGTMELAGRAFDAAVVNSDAGYLEKIGLNVAGRAQARLMVRLAGLLHDVGHTPFSHGPEALFPKAQDGTQWSHEHMTSAIIRGPELSDVLSSNPFETAPADAIAKIAVGPPYETIDDPKLRLLSELISGTLGVDRMDYLRRDGLYAGVSYGNFDLERLIGTLQIAQGEDGPVWCLESGGHYIAEQMLMARWFMFLQVYFHRTRRVLDHHLKTFLASWLPGGKFPTDLEAHLKLTDVEVLGALREAGTPERDRILSRGHLRCVEEFGNTEFGSLPDFQVFVSDLRTKNPDIELWEDSFTVSLRKQGDGELWIQQSGALTTLGKVSELVDKLGPRWIGRVYTPKTTVEAVSESIRMLRKNS